MTLAEKFFSGNFSANWVKLAAALVCLNQHFFLSVSDLEHRTYLNLKESQVTQEAHVQK